MKLPFTLFAILFISISSFGQQGINYKAVLKDTNGNILSNTYMTVQFTIHQASTTGTIVYQEDHNYTTDVNGLVVLNIGSDSTPVVGTFATLDWSANQHYLQTSITYSGGTINFDTVQFMAVPYAKHAETAANVFSGDYEDLINKPAISLPIALERITQNGKTGWRLQGVNQGFYGEIGENAIDLSYSPSTIPSNFGATGEHSAAFGYRSIASGYASVAIKGFAEGIGAVAIKGTASGYSSLSLGGEAKGYKSTSIGAANAESYLSVAIGAYNIGGGYEGDPYDSFSENWLLTDPLFEIGNGTSSIPNNALTVLKNGNTGINTSNPQSLFEVAHQNGGPTPSNLTNAISIKNLDSDKSWQFYVNNLGALVLYRNGIYTSYFHETSGAYVTVSDRRLKKDIIALDNGTLNKVMQLNPVSYLMKDQKTTKRNLGLISQEVQEIFPSITHYVEAQDILSLSYTELIPILIKALQEQQEIINAQNAKDVIQDKSIEALVTRLNLLEAKSTN